MKYVVVSVSMRESMSKRRGGADPSIEDVENATMSKIIEFGFEVVNDAEIISEHNDIPSANKAADEWNHSHEEMGKTDGWANTYIYGITMAMVVVRPETDSEQEELESDNVKLDDKNNLFLAS